MTSSPACGTFFDATCSPLTMAWVLVRQIRVRSLTNGNKSLSFNEFSFGSVPNHSVEEEPSDCVQSLERDGQSHRVCDGLMDCHDFSDEVACDYCPEGMVHCGVGAACIDVDRRCDGIPDCPNNSDERGCCKCDKYVFNHFLIHIRYSTQNLINALKIKILKTW